MPQFNEHAIRADGAKFLELMNTEEAKSRRAARDERYREDARAEWEMNYGRIIVSSRKRDVRVSCGARACLVRYWPEHGIKSLIRRPIPFNP